MGGAYYKKTAGTNLTIGETKAEPLNLETAKKIIGGRGLGTKILYNESVATVNLLSPEDKLVYITGPMTGSNSPSSARLCEHYSHPEFSMSVMKQEIPDYDARAI